MKQFFLTIFHQTFTSTIINISLYIQCMYTSKCTLQCTHYCILVASLCSMVLSFGKSLGPFSHNPPSEFSGLFEAATPGHEQVKLSPFISLGTSEDLAVSGPISMASYEGFVPAPIDTGGMTLPDPLRSIRDQLAYNLHEVWAKNKIEAGYRFAEVSKRSVMHTAKGTLLR